LAKLQKVGNRGGHLLDVGVVEALQLAKDVSIIVGNEVDGNSLASKTSRASNSVNVLLEVARQVVVDNERNLVDINTTGQKVGGDENTGRARAELSQDNLTLLLGDITMGRGYSEVTLTHLLSQVVDSLTGVAEDDGLSDVEGIVEIAQGVKLPVLTLNVNVELTNTFKGKFVLVDKNTDRVVHKATGDVEGIGGHGGREEANLDGGRESLEDIIDLVLETTGEHLISLIKNEDLDAVGLEGSSAEHIVDTTGGTNDNVDTVEEGLNVALNLGATDASVAENTEVVAEVADDLLDLLGKLTGGGKDEGLALLLGVVKLLQDTNGEGGSLTSTGLSLTNDITATTVARGGGKSGSAQ
jgi:hypothetical protein